LPAARRWLAALGELVTEKSGVLNLGVEGMMLVGAVVSSSSPRPRDSHGSALLAGAAAGAVMAAIFGVLTLSLMANQVATDCAVAVRGSVCRRSSVLAMSAW
jgi:simple sugar transport system permease protein